MMTNTSQYCSVTSHFKLNWTFLTDPVRSDKVDLDKVQSSGKFIYELGKKLKLTDKIIYEILQLGHKFFDRYSGRKYERSLMWHTIVFLVSKIWHIYLNPRQIHEAAAEISNSPLITLPWAIGLYERIIHRYEYDLVSTFGFKMFDRHPDEYFSKAIEKISNDTSFKTKVNEMGNGEELKNKLKYTAEYLAKQSILLTRFCITYSVDRIASFCVQFSIEINDMNIDSKVWLDGKITDKEVEDLICQFSRIFIECSAEYQQTFDDNELYELIQQKAKSHADILEDKLHELALANIKISTSPLGLPSSMTLYPPPSANLTSVPIMPVQDNTSVRTKRSSDSQHDDNDRKRSSASR